MGITMQKYNQTQCSMKITAIEIDCSIYEAVAEEASQSACELCDISDFCDQH